MSLQHEQHRQQMESLVDVINKQRADNSSASSSSFSSPPNFPAFDPSAELCTDYFSRFNTFVGAHSIPDAKVAQLFLTSQTPVTFKLIQNLASQNTPKMDINELSFENIETFMKDQFHPKRFVVRERFKFWGNMRRKPGETIQELSARIRQEAVTCDFASIKNPLDEAMRTRFMCSVENEAILKALFKVKDDQLTFAKAIEIATETEDAAKYAKETVHGETKSLQIVQDSSSIVLKTKKQSKLKSHKRDFPQGTCGRCGGTHSGKECRFKNSVCRFCSKLGHLEKVCLQKAKSKKPVSTIVNSVHRTSIFPQLKQNIQLAGKNLSFEVDTGAGENFISADVWKSIGEPHLRPVRNRFESASKHPLPVIGTFTTDVTCSNSTSQQNIQFVVTKVPHLNLLGRSAISKLNISVDNLLGTNRIHSVRNNETDQSLQKACKQICQEFPSLFEPGLGTLKDYELDIKFKPDASPVFIKPRPVPLALQDDLAAAYDAGIAKGVWKTAQFNEYGTPVVPIRKKTLSGQSTPQLRVCGDYSVTVNPQLETHRYPIPLPADLMRKLGGGYGFSKIDLADAYNQIKLSPVSQKKLALSTHRGVLLQNRLPFGISSAPGYFQEIMDQLTSDLPGVAVYLDDILVSGRNAEEHLQNLRQLLQRLHDKGMRCRLEKCVFAQPSVEYLGHQLSRNGIAKGPKVDAVTKMPPPTNVSGLRSFLGQVQFYNKFLSNLSTVLEPLYRLTKKDIKWRWCAEEQYAFQSVKDMLCTDTVLAHFDPSLDIGISCDASEYGIGSVLFHRYADGSERPIANVSKTLSPTQRKYSQIQKEALAIIFALSKFHQFLYGRKFILVTDHKPLLNLFSPTQPTPALAANRLARWSLTLSQYDYTIEYRKSSAHGNADALSRLPAGPDTAFDNKEDGDDTHSVCTINSISRQLNPTDPGIIAKESSKDPVISTVTAVMVGHRQPLNTMTQSRNILCNHFENMKIPLVVNLGVYSMVLGLLYQFHFKEEYWIFCIWATLVFNV